jgi:hypothetical protein
MKDLLPREFYQDFFADYRGQQVLDDLKKRFYDIQTYTKQDPYHTAFLEGRRSVVRQILTAVQPQPIEEIQDDF